MRKSSVIDSISKLPDEFSLDELIERLIVLEKIEKGQLQIKDGKTNNDHQAKVKLDKRLH